MALDEEYSTEYQFKTEDLLSTKKEDRQKKRQERRRIRHYKFTDKKHPPEAIASFITGYVALGLFIAAIVLATKADGNGGRLIGILGLFSLIVSIAGIICALAALYKRDVKTALAWHGLICSAVVFFIIVCIVLIYL